MTHPPEAAESDTDRQRVVAAVKAALAARNLSASEWEARLAADYIAETDLELTQVIRILKLPPADDSRDEEQP